MRLYIVCVVGVLGCGSVKSPPSQQDAAGGGDAPSTCTIWFDDIKIQ